MKKMSSKQSFTLNNMVKAGEWDNVDFCWEPLDNNRVDGVENSGNEYLGANIYTWFTQELQ